MERFPLHSWKMEFFYLISRDHNEPIKRPQFNEVLYKRYSFTVENQVLWIHQT